MTERFNADECLAWMRDHLDLELFSWQEEFVRRFAAGEDPVVQGGRLAGRATLYNALDRWVNRDA